MIPEIYKETKTIVGLIYYEYKNPPPGKKYISVKEYNKRYFPPVIKRGYQKVHQYDINKRYVQSFDNCTLAAQSVNRSRSSVGKAVTNKVSLCKHLSAGFYWSYEDRSVKKIDWKYSNKMAG